MFLHYFVNYYFVRLRTNHYTLFTISPILVIFDSATNLLYRPLWHFVKIPIVWRERQNAKWEKWLTGWFTKCHLYTSHFSHFANIFSRSSQFDDKCIGGSRKLLRIIAPVCTLRFFFKHVFYLFLTADRCLQLEIVCSNIFLAEG